MRKHPHRRAKSEQSFLSWVGNASMKPLPDALALSNNEEPVQSPGKKEPISPLNLSSGRAKRVGMYKYMRDDGSVIRREIIFKIIKELNSEYEFEEE